MKLIFAIVNSDDATSVTHHLTQRGFSSTRMATTGGFLKMGNTTILVGTEEEKVQEALDIIKEESRSRKVIIPASADIRFGGALTTIPTEVTVGGATIFVVDVDHFERA